MQLVLSAALGLLGGWWLGPDKLFILTLGFVLVIAVIIIYVVANLGVVRYTGASSAATSTGYCTSSSRWAPASC